MGSGSGGKNIPCARDSCCEIPEYNAASDIKNYWKEANVVGVYQGR
jgi:hypothetical protein